METENYPIEEESKLTKKFKTRAIAIAAASLLGIFTYNGSQPGEIKTLTSTYQGCLPDETNGKNYLVFDKYTKVYRTPGREDLVIQGNPDTLEIGKDYTIQYSVPRWEKVFLDKKEILSIK